MLSIDRFDDTPAFEQLKRQLAAQIMARQLRAGTKLPTVRQLAADVGVAVNTIARVYKELEADGFVETRGRNGTHVTAIAGKAYDVGPRAAELTAAYVREMAALGLGPQAILAAIKQEL